MRWPFSTNETPTPVDGDTVTDRMGRLRLVLRVQRDLTLSRRLVSVTWCRPGFFSRRVACSAEAWNREVR